MLLFRKSVDLNAYLNEQRRQGISIGFVPTMGALHAGHISLIEQSREEAGITVSSIFVNPTQFNDSKDFEKYPVTTDSDINQLEATGCDVLFLPAVREIYPQGTSHLEHYELGYLETILEGKFRPGHFQGVCQVVERLLKMVQPHFLFLGQKDYQQCMVIKKMMVDLNIKTTLHIVPTQREANGLAMSSRNQRLNENARIKATAIFKALSFVKEKISCHCS